MDSVGIYRSFQFAKWIFYGKLLYMYQNETALSTSVLSIKIETIFFHV